MKVIVEMLSYPFLVRALVVGVLVSLCASLLGVSLVLKRYSMIGDGLSHVGFGALAIATALNLAPLAVAVPVVVVGNVIAGGAGKTPTTLAIVQHLCHQVAVLYQGRIVEYGNTAQVLQPPLHLYTQALLAAAP